MEAGGEHVPWDSKVILAVCPVCTAPLLATQDDFTDFPEVGSWTLPVRIYPAMNRDFGRAVPEDIARAFKEAPTCFRAEAYTAAAIMCRKTRKSKRFEPQSGVL